MSGYRGGAATGLLALATALGCETAKAHEITLLEGAVFTRFHVKTALAEYVELPGQRNELRLTLAAYAASCERWISPANDERAVTVVIVLPPETCPAVATYGWTGIPPPDEPIREPYALPKAQHGSGSRLFEPGGNMRITRVQLEPHGIVSGTLAFEFPGTADRPATRIDGGFDATFCRVATAAR